METGCFPSFFPIFFEKDLYVQPVEWKQKSFCKTMCFCCVFLCKTALGDHGGVTTYMYNILHIYVNIYECVHVYCSMYRTIYVYYV